MFYTYLVCLVVNAIIVYKIGKHHAHREAYDAWQQGIDTANDKKDQRSPYTKNQTLSLWWHRGFRGQQDFLRAYRK